jgi:class 3 adenylate cyclase
VVITLLVILPVVSPMLLALLVFFCLGKKGRVFLRRCAGLANLGAQPGGNLDLVLDAYPASEPPKTGQITVVVTDIQSSTKLWQLCPEDMDAAQAMHDQLLRKLLRKHRGYEMITEGDSFIVVFHTPRDALAWCVAGQTALQDAVYSDTLLVRFAEVYGALGSPSSADPRRGSSSFSTVTAGAFSASDAAAAQANVRGTMDNRDCVHGMRVRMGMHTGHVTSVNKDDKTKRWNYDGPTVNIARAVSDAAAGGQILFSGETMAELAASNSPDESSENGCDVYSMGRHQLAVSHVSEGLRTSVRYGGGGNSASTIDILRSEMSESGEEARGRNFADTVHRCEILCAVPCSLPLRAGFFHKLGSVRQLTPSYFEAPPKDDISVVFTYIQGASALESWNKKIYVEAVALMKACMHVTLVESGGYEIRENQGNYLLGFKSPAAAAEWCVLSQHALLNLSWNKELLLQPKAALERHKRYAIFSGLRIAMGISTGRAESAGPCKRTGRAEYFGHVLNQTARIARCASGGQVLCSSLSLQRLSSQTLKFFHLKDLGTFILKDIQIPEHIFQISSPPLEQRIFPELSVPREKHAVSHTPTAAALVREVNGLSLTHRVYSGGEGFGSIDGSPSLIAPPTEIASQLDEEQISYLAAFESVSLSHNAMKSRYVRMAQKLQGAGVFRSNSEGLDRLLLQHSCSGSGSTLSHADLNLKSSQPPLADKTVRTLENELLYIDTWGKFDVFAVDRLSGGHALTSVVLSTIKALNLHSKLSLDMKVMEKFCLSLEREYKANSYHTAVHAADVTQAVAFILVTAHNTPKLVVTEETSEAASELPFLTTPGTPFLTPLQELSLVMAAAVHDVSHPGLNNNFLIQTKSHFSRLYHDRSVNENMHLDIAFQLMEAREHDVMGMLEESNQLELRKMLIRIVLQTDMALHGDLLRKFLDVAEANEGRPVKSWDDPIVALEFILHVADISNPARPDHLFFKWAEMLAEEFFSQGEKEASLGMPVTPFCNRETANIYKNQLGFIDVVVAVSFEALSVVIEPSVLDEWNTNLLKNREFYAKESARTVWCNTHGVQAKPVVDVLQQNIS